MIHALNLGVGPMDKEPEKSNVISFYFLETREQKLL